MMAGNLHQLEGDIEIMKQKAAWISGDRYFEGVLIFIGGPQHGRQIHNKNLTPQQRAQIEIVGTLSVSFLGRKGPAPTAREMLIAARRSGKGQM